MKLTTMFTVLITALLMIAVVAPEAPAQQLTPVISKVATNKAFVASQADTSAVLDIGSANILSFVTYCNDTCYAWRIFQYRHKIKGIYAGAWTAALRDTINGDGAQIKEAVLRAPSTDLGPGASCDWRVITQFKSTAQGVSGNEKYYGWWYFRP